MVRNLLGLAFFSLALTYGCLAQELSRPQPTSVQSRDYREIELLEKEWNTANEESDVEAIQRILADDSYHVGPSGKVYDKNQDVAAQTWARERKRASNIFPKFITQERQIKLFKDLAIVTGLGAKLVTKDGQQQLTGKFRFVHIWERRNNRWQLIIDQVTAVR